MRYSWSFICGTLLYSTAKGIPISLARPTSNFSLVPRLPFHCLSRTASDEKLEVKPGNEANLIHLGMKHWFNYS